MYFLVWTDSTWYRLSVRMQCKRHTIRGRLRQDLPILFTILKPWRPWYALSLRRQITVPKCHCLTRSKLLQNYARCSKNCLESMAEKAATLKVSKFRKQIFLFSFESKNEWNYFLISALASKNGSNQKNEGTLSY